MVDSFPLFDGARNSELNEESQQENVRASIHELHLNRRWVLQKEAVPKTVSLSRMMKAEEILRFGDPDLHSRDTGIEPLHESIPT